MNKRQSVPLIITFVIVVIAFLFALAGSQAGSMVGSIPVYILVVGLIFLIQWAAFIPAFINQTEKFYDLTGSLTYISVTILAFFLSSGVDARATLLLVLVLVWAGRLGTFLFRRVQKAGRDDRFDEIKPNFFRFLNAWTLQALWITFTASAAHIAITTDYRKDLDLFAIAGLVVWVFGFAFEATADAQKSRFNADPQNKGKFINTGLWAHSRHPNYFGEIVLWIGVALIAFPVLQGWQYLTLISPLFIILLLTRISGVPMLEKRADDKWGGQEDYERYKANTSILIPRPPKGN